MLKKLTIKNIALIDYIQIDFFRGLNVLSGETGAGKSIIIESLNFVLGEKADRTLIRSGENECSVVAEFEVGDNCVLNSIFESLDLEFDNTIIISRKFNIDGKGSIKVNGQTVTASMLKKISSQLVDVFGQSEHFNLLSEVNQLNMLDSFGENEILYIKQEISELLSNYRIVCSKLDEVGGDEQHRLIRLDVLNYQINEIIKCDLKEGEEEKLNEIKQKLIHREKIFNALSNLNDAISGEGGVSDVLSNALRSINGIVNFSDDFLKLYERVDSLISESDDISSLCKDIISETEDFDYNPDEIEARIEDIKKIKKKYGENYYEIQKFLDNALNEKNLLENSNEICEKLNKEKQQIELNIYDLYLKLSNSRKKFAKIFTSNVANEFIELGMEKAKFDIDFSDLPSIENCSFVSENGIDNVKYMFTANLGEPLKPLSLVISGGELSRFMLAIKTQTSKYNNIGTFIFDEIDTGISGNIAKVIAEKFYKIASSVQIIAISHLPQISAIADNNLLISKFESNGKTYSKVEKLTDEEKILEIIRLIGGKPNSETARKYAIDLISSFKK